MSDDSNSLIDLPCNNYYVISEEVDEVDTAERGSNT